VTPSAPHPSGNLATSILEALPVPVVVDGPDGIEAFNAAAGRILGLGPTHIGTPLANQIGKHHRTRWYQLATRTRAGQHLPPEDFAWGDRDAIVWSVRTTPLPDVGPEHILVAFETSSTRPLANEALLESGCILWDARLEKRGDTLCWDRRLVNPQAAQRVVPLDLATAASWLSAYHASLDPEDAKEGDRQLEEALETGVSTLVREFRCRDRDGQLHWISETIRTRPAGDKAWHLTSVGIDITPRKATEDEIRSALGAARSASLAKSEFLANMSHEIRTPMNAVLGMTELLLQTPLTEDQRDLVSTAHRSGRALLSILNDILDLSKIEADRVDLAHESFDLRDLCEEVAALFAEPSQERGVEILTRYRPDIPVRWMGDPGRIRQILSNLVGNAVKFTERGCIVLDVRGWVPRPDDRGKLAITVRDSGVGIASEKIPNLFQPFVQADMSTTRRYGGTGLGLAISRRLAKRMHGDITVSSKAGQGAVFRLSLTLDAPQIDSPPAPAARQVAVLTRLEDLGRSLADACAALGFESHVRHAVGDLLATCQAVPQVGWVLADLPEDAFADLVRKIRDLRGDIQAIRLVPLHHSTHLQSSPLAPHLTKPVRLQPLARALGRTRTAPIALSLQEGRMVLPDNSPLASALRILVAEDNQINQKVILRQLDRLGIQADLAEDGESALRALEAGHYHLAFLDVQMPYLEGPDVARRWRELESERGLPRTPLVALTASALVEERDRCLQSGMDAFLSKPVSQAELAQTMSQWARID